MIAIGRRCCSSFAAELDYALTALWSGKFEDGYTDAEALVRQVFIVTLEVPIVEIS